MSVSYIERRISILSLAKAEFSFKGVNLLHQHFPRTRKNGANGSPMGSVRYQVDAEDPLIPKQQSVMICVPAKQTIF